MAANQITANPVKGGDATLKNLDVTGTLTVGTLATTGESTVSVQSGMTALAGGAQAGTALAARWSRFSTVASANDSAQLPAAVVGVSRVVKNAHATNSMNIFPQTGQSINALAANAAFALAATKAVEFRCTVAGVWDTLLSA
jgi:hypothetical protein